MRVACFVLAAPVIEPAGPVFAGHERLIGAHLEQLLEGFLGFAGAKVDDRGQLGERAVGNSLGTIGGVEQGVAEAAVLDELPGSGSR